MNILKNSWFIIIECLEFKIKYFIYFVFELLNILKCKKIKIMNKEKKKPLAMLMDDLLVGPIGLI
jgi:phosphatidylglycerophosphatase A